MGISWACLFLRSVCHAKGSGCHAKGSGQLPWWSQQWAAGAPSNPTACACIPECYLCTYFSPLTVLGSSAKLICMSECAWFAWVNALCNLFRKKSQKVAAATSGWFMSRCWFTLCVTVEVNLELWSSASAATVAFARITRERQWRMGKKCLNLHRFPADHSHLRVKR